MMSRMPSWPLLQVERVQLAIMGGLEDAARRSEALAGEADRRWAEIERQVLELPGSADCCELGS